LFKKGGELFNYIAIGILSFLFGFIVAAFVYKKKTSENMLFCALNDFKKTIEEYKTQNIINTKEVKDAIKTAGELTKILTTNQNLKGQFGEDCLESILKSCYPAENVNYIKQFETVNLEENKIKPDFLVKLPNDRVILIDCKVNLEKYIEFKESGDSTVSKEKRNEFIKDLNSTVNMLSNKKYESAKDLLQPDFILMYIPLEPVVTQIYTDKDFLSVVKNANEKNIIIVGNSSVLTTIRLTKLLWAQDAQEKNIQNIISTAQEIYKLIAKHSEALFKVKAVLNENTELFNKEFEKIKESNIFKMTENLRNYGIQTSNKKIGKKLDEIKINSEFLK